MSDARNLHRKAMQLVHEANIAKDEGNVEAYLRLTNEALQLEGSAANMLYATVEAEPTRSILYRSAATLAFNCGKFSEAERYIFSALSGNPPLEIEFELRDIFERITESKWLVDEEVQDYTLINILRERGLNVKLAPKNRIYGEHIVKANDMLSFFSAVKSSFANFVRISFKREFSIDSFRGDFDKVLNNVVARCNILFVNLKFRSFSATISSDVVMDAGQFSVQINEWRKTVFDEYKNDVFNIDFNNQESLRYLLEKYSDEERVKIYGGVLNSFQEKSSYVVSITKDDLETVVRTLPVVSKQIREKIAVLHQPTDDESRKVLVESVAFLTEGKFGNIPKSSILYSRQLESGNWTVSFSDIKYGDKQLLLKDPITAKLVYENEVFTLEFSLINLIVHSGDPNKITLEFNKAFIDLYTEIVVNGNAFSDEELVTQELLRDIVFSRNWE